MICGPVIPFKASLNDGHEVLAITDNVVNVTHLLHRDIDDAWEFCEFCIQKGAIQESLKMLVFPGCHWQMKV